MLVGWEIITSETCLYTFIMYLVTEKSKRVYFDNWLAQQVVGCCDFCLNGIAAFIIEEPEGL